ncbi:DNA-(apurinic or apyrimidinic site) lyase [Purpureocillium takamizusanense]|uniref:DNA-(Apurinic or apyrimidinic site) lyase n=1 Tax=Purpureocillium takamizusanense TaxID=2060973 RepID=A0A9Q8Q9E2_9HYPO|nr:DNA-(apurinic or apyrimidinic site) lyase [Purpureocillium takamizusanense]UNI14954.1 DNA-(apurinic or apyrimidinic site) lyase [Purpureocillium takamizusanense]
MCSITYMYNPEPDPKQPRICDSLGWPCHHPKNFFDLPRHIRRRIYIEAGLSRGYTGPLTQAEILNLYAETKDLGAVDRALKAIRQPAYYDIASPVWDNLQFSFYDDDIEEALLYLLKLPDFIWTRVTNLTICLHEQWHHEQYEFNGWYSSSKESIKIRQRILRFTDLITPWKEVQWDSERGFYIGAFEWARYPLNSSYHIDFCHNHAASYSARCVCWMPPKALFVVSKAMSREAAQVFYSCNNITVKDRLSHLLRHYNLTHGLLDGALFMGGRIRPELLGNIRTLELALPRLRDTCNLEEQMESALRRWRSAIKHLSRHANLRALTLVVLIDLWGGAYKSGSIEFVAQDLDEQVFLSSLPIVDPFKQIRDVNRFFVRLEWSGHWSPGYVLPDGATTTSDDKNYHRRRGAKLERIELELEKFVMGGDYDSRALGKYNGRRCFWMAQTWENEHVTEESESDDSELYDSEPDEGDDSDGGDDPDEGEAYESDVYESGAYEMEPYESEAYESEEYESEAYESEAYESG